ncbi:MAG TPA: glycosyltransferase family 4 protein [Acetobacteraceae bacterium]|nr:glycosyltransferase family 4 protein [Acetobacteraceae bacterium]
MIRPPAGPGRIFLTTDAVGGVWTYTLDVARGFAERGAEVDIAVLGPAPDRAKYLEAASIPGARVIETGEALEWCAASPEALARSAGRLAELAARRGAATAHLHSPSLLAESFPVPVLVTLHSCVATWWRAVHGDALLPEMLAWQADATKRGLQRADRVVAPTLAFANAARQVYRLRRPIRIVPNGRRPLHAPPAESRTGALAAGRLWDEGKNIAAVDRAAAGLDIPVFAAGPLEGPNGASINLAHARAVGQLDSAALAALMARVAVFAAPALYEPFGLAILEAAQAGLPLVLGDIPTLREIWDGVAIFIPPRDDAALAAAIAQLHADSHYAAALGSTARRRAARFTTEAMISALWEIHCGLAEAPVAELA